MLSNRIKQVLIDKINFKRPAERPAEPIAVGQEVAYSDTDTESDSDTDSDTGTDFDTENKVMPTNQAYTDPTMSTNKAYSHSADTLEKKLPSKVYTNIRVCMYKIITDEMIQIMQEENIKTLNEIRGCAHK